MVIRFFDTSTLLDIDLNRLKTLEEKFYISPVTLKELNDIKVSPTKDDTIKYKARHLAHWLDENASRWEIHRSKSKSRDTTNGDTMILSDAIDLFRLFSKSKSIMVNRFELYTNDLIFKLYADIYFQKIYNEERLFEVKVISELKQEEDDYCGYIEKVLSEEEMAFLYENPNINSHNLLMNQYLVIKDNENSIKDVVMWTGETHRRLIIKPFESMMYGKVSPKKDDIYQSMLFDCLRNNRLVMIKGKPGAGKSYIALAYLMSELEREKISKIIIFCNPVATLHAARLGFYPGSKDDKLLDSQIGNFIKSNLGGSHGLDRLIEKGQLEILPMSDIRGYDTTSDSKVGVYITEAQNMDISLMKLALQRLGENSICIIDGDCEAQVDNESFSGNNNGMRRMSQVFRGTDVYGEVELKKIHRSRIAEIADKM